MIAGKSFRNRRKILRNRTNRLNLSRGILYTGDPLLVLVEFPEGFGVGAMERVGGRQSDSSRSGGYAVTTRRHYVTVMRVPLAPTMRALLALLAPKNACVFVCSETIRISG
jgi:hypothetical protein